MRCAWMRALTSTPPPAAKGTTSVIGRVGQSCAAAVPVIAIDAAAAAITIVCMLVSLTGRTLASHAGGIKDFFVASRDGERAQRRPSSPRARAPC